MKNSCVKAQYIIISEEKRIFYMIIRKTYKFLFTASLLFAILIVASGCTVAYDGNAAPPTIPSSYTSPSPYASAENNPPSAAPMLPTPEPGMPNQIGLYINDSGIRKLVETSHKSDWITGQDIKCYEAIASREAVLTGSGFAEIWNTCWNKFTKIQNVKIGYQIEILLKSSETIFYDVKTPDDTQKNREYVETYLYDDVHQTPGQWYSHLEPSDLMNDTIATSIKFTAGSKISEIEKIRLTAYLYTTDLPERIIAQYGIDILKA